MPEIAPIVSLTLLGLALGAMLGLAARKFHVEGNPLADEIEAMLPGSQCGQCGHPGCGPAAQALAEGLAPITLCPPGGRALAEALADKLSVSADLSGMADGPQYAFIREALCDGCGKCYKRCPTDAIVGAPKQLHTVIPDICSGCGACVEICPNQGVNYRPFKSGVDNWVWPKPQPRPATATTADSETETARRTA